MKVKTKDARIKSRLTKSFVFVTVITSIAAVLGIIAMWTMHVQYNSALQNFGFSQGDIGKAMTCLSETRSSLRAAIGYDKQDEIDEAVQNYEDYKQKTKDYIDAIEKYMITDAGRESYDKITESTEAYWSIADEVIQQGAVTDREVSAKAQDRAINEVRPAYDTLYKSMKNLMTVNVDKGTQLEKSLTNLAIVLIIAMIVIIAISAYVSTRLGRRISTEIAKPLKDTSDRLVTFAKGDLDSPFPEVAVKDEIHEMVEVVRGMAINLNDIITDVGYLLAEMASGNFTEDSHVKDKYVGKFELLLTSIEQMSDKMDGTLQQVEDASEQVSAGAGNLAEAAEALADGATDQAGSVEELQATITDITETVEQTAEDLQAAAQNAKQYAQDAGHSREQMEETVKAMERISDSSQKIENIISELEDIASQTNLLSLNASIEAARAGEAGRGFAVVADQIRNLAEQSATSAVSTRALIEGSIHDVEEGNKAVEAVSATLDAVVKGMSAIADTSESLSEQSTNQARAMEQVQLGINQISEVVQSNSAAAEETSATSEELSAQAETLETLVANFQLKSKQ